MKLTKLTRPNPLFERFGTYYLTSKGEYPFAYSMAAPGKNPTHLVIINRNAAIKAWRQGRFKVNPNFITVSYEA